MAFEVTMPRLGWSMEVGTLAGWHKKDGDRVEAGEILFTVEGDKALQEVEALESGVLVGFPVVDVKARLVDGSYHEVDSSDIAFKIAGSMAARDAVGKGKPILLEPIMRVEVVAPESFTGTVIDDLNSRRGQISAVEA